MKAVLVINMPRTCEYCQFICSSDGGSPWLCAVSSAKNTMMTYKCKPSWCPLKLLPERDNESHVLPALELDEWYSEGWNDCLNAITGEEND